MPVLSPQFTKNVATRWTQRPQTSTLMQKNTKRWAVHPDGSRLRFKIHTSFKDFSVEKLHEVLRSLLASASGGCGCTVLAHTFVLTARFFHVVPFRKRYPCSMGYFNVQTPRLYFDSSLTYLSLLVHTDHDAWHLGPADNRREHSARCIVTSKISLAHATDVVDDKRFHFLFGHVYRNGRTESVWAIFAHLMENCCATHTIQRQRCR